MPSKSPRAYVLVLPLLVLGACSTVPTAPAQGGAATPAGWRQRLIEPLTSPTIFESPVIDTQLRPMVMLQTLPNDSVFTGGDVRVYAVQARYAVNDRLAVIATKDGYVEFEPDAGTDETGMADIAAGVKYAVVDDPSSGLLVTPGVIFEFASGDEEVFQGNGDGLIRPFVSAGLDREAWNVLGALGLNLPLDTDEESTSFDWHAHVSYEVIPAIAPLLEVNGITWTNGGNAAPFDFEGGDLINLGSTDAEGTVVTGALGLRWNCCPGISVGAGYEVPLTDREDLFNDRITVDLVWSL